MVEYDFIYCSGEMVGFCCQGVVYYIIDGSNVLVMCIGNVQCWIVYFIMQMGEGGIKML